MMDYHEVDCDGLQRQLCVTRCKSCYHGRSLEGVWFKILHGFCKKPPAFQSFQPHELCVKDLRLPLFWLPTTETQVGVEGRSPRHGPGTNLGAAESLVGQRIWPRWHRKRRTEKVPRCFALGMMVV